jgi:hypothetical protein
LGLYNRKIVISFFELVLPRWLLMAMICMGYINIKFFFANSFVECNEMTDTCIAYLLLYMFFFMSMLGYGIMEIMNLTPEMVEKLYRAVVGKNHK